MMKRGTFGNRVLELKYDLKNAFYVEKMPPGDRLRMYMITKNSNFILGDLAIANNQILMLSLLSLKANLHMTSNNGIHVQITQDVLVNFFPHEARFTISPGQNATFCVLAAFVLASKLKRAL